MTPTQIYGYIAAALFILGIFTAQYIIIQKQNTAIADLNTEVAYKEIAIDKFKYSNEELKRVIHVSNEKLSKISVDLDKARQSLDEWKAKKPEIRYEVIYKIREQKSNDCNTTKNVLDSIRNLDYSRL